MQWESSCNCAGCTLCCIIIAPHTNACIKASICLQLHFLSSTEGYSRAAGPLADMGQGKAYPKALSAQLIFECLGQHEGHQHLSTPWSAFVSTMLPGRVCL